MLAKFKNWNYTFGPGQVFSNCDYYNSRRNGSVQSSSVQGGSVQGGGSGQEGFDQESSGRNGSEQDGSGQNDSEQDGYGQDYDYSEPDSFGQGGSGHGGSGQAGSGQAGSGQSQGGEGTNDSFEGPKAEDLRYVLIQVFIIWVEHGDLATRR